MTGPTQSTSIPMQVKINARRLVNVLFICLAVLFLMNFILILVTGMKYRGALLNQVFHKFYFDSKFNFPSFFNTLLLLMATGILYYIHLAYARKYFREFKWLWLAILFMLMAIEENLSVHTLLGSLQPDYRVWVIPIGIALILLAAYFGRLAWKLPRRIAIGFFVSGAVYITGAIILQFIGARAEDSIGKWSMMHAGIATLEETMEMLGIILFIRYLLEYIKLEFQSVNLTVE